MSLCVSLCATLAILHTKLIPCYTNVPVAVNLLGKLTLTVKAKRPGLEMATLDEGTEKDWFCCAQDYFKSGVPRH